MIKVAECSGFCFGVRRAVEKVEFLLKKGVKVSTLGELIHNKPFCEKLKKKGMRVVEEVHAGCVKSNECLVIRSHGAGPYIYEFCAKNGIKVVDATCPFVKRIHKIVTLKSSQGRKILIAGDENHPEVCAIKKYCSGPVFVFSEFDRLWPYLEQEKENLSKLVLVAQTTFNSIVWAEGVKKLEAFNFSSSEDIEIFNTICQVTEQRQRRAIELAKEVDLMVVIGGKNSSNSRKLSELCSKFCRTVFVETAKELEIFLQVNRLPRAVGLSAGASTPLETIQEIYEQIEKKQRL